MPVSLDKIPAPRPEDMDRAPSYRVELRKFTAGFFVVADFYRLTITTVERAADNDVERSLQEAALKEQAAARTQWEHVYIVRAENAARAAGLIRRNFWGLRPLG
ncbi:hypothetical protein ABZ023_18545 [Streptomyces sp. NPDC006367]|uniref:hypothetical protein n=1 Tax=unclassified Streptomyces TaxID=2593676 RepID=UPI0033A4BF7D